MSTLKKIFLGSLAAVTFVFYSCGNNNKDTAYSENHDNKDSKEVAEEHNDAKFEKAAEADAQFLVDVATINMKEIALGNLASTKGQTKEVRDLGKMMVDAHTKSQRELESLAGRKGVTLPATTPDESTKDYDNLKDEKNIDFDKKYANAMVDGHKEAVSKFIKASTDCQDADIRDWAAKMLPDLRAHLDHAMNTQTQLRAYKD